MHSRPWRWIRAHLCSSLITQNNTDSLHCCLPSACLCCLLCLPSLLTLCSLYCVAADMHGKQAERSLSFFLSLSLSVTLFLCHSLTYSRVLTSEVLGGEAFPCVFVTLCQPVECHWENITSANVALCDTAFEVEKSATCEQSEGTLPHGCMLEKPWVRPERKRKGGEGALCVFVCREGVGGCLGTWHKWSLELLRFGGSGANCSVTSGNTFLSLTKHQRKETLHM